MVTLVYGKAAVFPSLYQMAPDQVLDPAGVSFAIQWMREKKPRVMIPLAVICG